MENVLLQITVCALAAFRLAELLVVDDGPFDLFMNLRGWFNKADFDRSLRRTIANGLSCVHCVGLWMAFLLFFLLSLSNVLINFVILSLAIAGLQSILANKVGRA